MYCFLRELMCEILLKNVLQLFGYVGECINEKTATNKKNSSKYKVKRQTKIVK